MRYKWWQAWDRFYLHLPVGWVIVGLTALHWALGLIYALLFLAYEFSEDHYVKDEAWRDIAGSMAGMMSGGAAWGAWRLLT